MSAVYIQMLSRKLTKFTIEANTMSPDQTAPMGAVWSGFILFSVVATNLHKQKMELTFVVNSGKWISYLWKIELNFFCVFSFLIQA